MTTRSVYFAGAFVDVCVAVGLFAHWVLVSVIFDAASLSHLARKFTSLWLALSSSTVSAVRIYSSFRLLGTGAERSQPETVVGVFAEIVAMAQTWGLCFLAVRTWELSDLNPVNVGTFLHAAGDSVFEMSLVQAGVGWAATAPVSLGERAVAWCAAYIGGVLVTNLYLLTVVVGQRGWWNLVPDARAARADATRVKWEFQSLVH